MAFVTELATLNAQTRLLKPHLDNAPASLEWLTGDADLGGLMGADFSAVSLTTELERIQRLLDDPDCVVWSIEHDGEVVGVVEINSIAEVSQDRGVRGGRLSILIGAPHLRGKGLGLHATTAVFDWAFADGTFALIEVRVKPHNRPSRALFTGLGVALLDVGEWGVGEMTAADWRRQSPR